MKVHFVIVSEASKSFMNMTKLLLFSIRKNAGTYKNNPCTIVINGSTLPPEEVQRLKDRFSPVEVCSMPRLGSIPVANKFNAFYVLDKVDYDAMIFLDCDTIVLKELSSITNNIEDTNFFFSARPETNQVFARFRYLMEHYGNLDNSTSGNYYSDVFPNKYPLFNSGVFVISRQAILKVREDAVRITYDLYDRKKFKFIAKHYNRFLKIIYKKVLKYKFQPLLPLSVYYSLGLVEEIGLALALIKNRVPFQILDRQFNFSNNRFFENKSLPVILHYMKRNFKIDREDLFNGDWKNDYLKSDIPTRIALAKLVQDYNHEAEYFEAK